MGIKDKTMKSIRVSIIATVATVMALGTTGCAAQKSTTATQNDSAASSSSVQSKDVSAQYDKGFIAFYHERDYATALRIFSDLAHKGDAASQTFLGYIYAEGRGVEKDPTKPVPLIELKVEHYMHKKYGKVLTPIFNITDWVSMDANAVEEPEDAELEVAAEPEAAEGARRRRRVA